eukprot:c49603_g1_i1 orf=206-391(+)
MLQQGISGDQHQAQNTVHKNMQNQLQENLKTAQMDRIMEIIHSQLQQYNWDTTSAYETTKA